MKQQIKKEKIEKVRKEYGVKVDILFAFDEELNKEERDFIYSTPLHDFFANYNDNFTFKQAKTLNQMFDKYLSEKLERNKIDIKNITDTSSIFDENEKHY